MLGVDTTSLNLLITETRQGVADIRAVVAQAQRLIAAVPPAQVGTVIDRLSESGDAAKDAIAKLDQAAENVLAVTEKFKAVLK